MRIVMITGAAGQLGHGETYTRRLVAGLQSEDDLDVAVVVPSDAPRFEFGDDTTVHRTDTSLGHLRASRFSRYGPAAGALRGIARVSASRKFLHEGLEMIRDHLAEQSIVHILDAEYLAMASTIRHLGRLSVPVIVTLHPSNFALEGFSVSSLYKAASRLALLKDAGNISRVICHGSWIGDRLRQQFGGKLDITSLFYPSESVHSRITLAEARAALQLPTEQKLVLCFGMLRSDKRIDLALDTLAHLPSDYDLVVAGAPADVTASRLSALIQTRGLEDRTHLFLGYQSEKNMRLLYSAADVFLSTHDPSFSSASGPVADARGFRLPIVAGPAGQIRAYVEQYGVGLIAESDKPHQYAQQILRITTDAQARHNIDRALERAASLLSWEQFARRHAEVYREVATDTAQAIDPMSG